MLKSKIGFYNYVRFMSNLLSEYCIFTKKFKSNHNIIIVNLDMKILCITNPEFFTRYNAGFEENSNLFDCLKHLPLMDKKSEIYTNLIISKKVQGYFIAQDLDGSSGHLIDRVYLSPIMDENQELVGIELECISMAGLPIINILDEEKDYQLHFPTLTKREYEIAVLKYLGKTDREISEILSTKGSPVSDKTIASIVYNQLYRKLDVHNKSDLIKKIHNSGMDKFIPKSLIASNQLIVFSTLDLS
ncbi:hypothetical protein CUN60_11565 [Aquella oligotrophica]|uniref:HTH luxR-type domain-containing protein n=2 Tax=Aquella oligotrophica TaxID=2067065 RepID=A0A2I7N8W1_9NEIS|nr:hypothetical protein CUN60_11565 [Aquella oligotrophica]